MRCSLLRGIVLSVTWGLMLAAIAPTQTRAAELRLSHQWPETDARHRAARVLAAEMKKRNVDLTITIHPNSSLNVKAVDQLDAMVAGKFDMAIYPLAYATAKIPEMGIAGLPGLPANWEAAGLLKGTEFEDKLQEVCDKHGFRILTWWWVGGGIAGRTQAIGGPKSVKGLSARGGDGFNEMLKAAHAVPVNITSNEIRTFIEAGKLDVAMTSFESFMSFRIPEYTKFATLGGPYGIFTVFTPIIISSKALRSLNGEQRLAIDEAATASEIYFEATQREAEEGVIEAFTKAGAKIQQLSFDEYREWLEVAKGSTWKKYQAASRDADELFTKMLRSFVATKRQ